MVGTDVDPRVVACVNEGRSPVREPGVDDLIARCEGRLSADLDVARAVRATDVSFIVVPTPSKADGGFSIRFVLDACDRVGEALRGKQGHLVVISSTVMPGSTGGPIREHLEQASRATCGVDFMLCYSPEFIALGTVVRDLLNPDFLLIGESEQRAGDLLSTIYASLSGQRPPVRRMSWVNAELTKLALNAFVTTKISYANMLTQICERLEGADIDTVTGALGLDRRIGPAFFRGGLGYGGPCFPRDNLALGAVARGVGVQPILPEATDAVNRLQIPRIIDLVLALGPHDDGVVAILGLSYKPDTDVVVESQGLELARALLDRGVRVRMYDPMALDTARAALESRGEYAPTMAACVSGATLIAIMTPWPEFRDLASAGLGGLREPPVVLECWRMLAAGSFEGVARYVGLGHGVGAR